jgi:plasmid stabilization system protein ParE
VPQLRWTRSATTALSAIVRRRREQVGFIAARALHERITQHVFLLKDFPELGKLLDDVPDDDRRELLVSVYRVVYRIEQDTVLVISIEDARLPVSHHDDADDTVT